MPTHVSGFSARCVECNRKSKNLGRWRESTLARAPPTEQLLALSGVKRVHNSVPSCPDLLSAINTAGIEKSVRDVLHPESVSSPEERVSKMARITKHLAIEPSIFQSVNPIQLTEFDIVALCPTMLDAERSALCTCAGYTIKKKRVNNILYCNYCSDRSRQQNRRSGEFQQPLCTPVISSALNNEPSEYEGGSVAETSLKREETASDRINLKFRLRAELESICRERGAEIRRLRKRLAARIAENIRIAAKSHVGETEAEFELDKPLLEQARAACAHSIHEPALVRDDIEKYLINYIEVIKVPYKN